MLQMDDDISVSLEAFSRIASAVPIIANVIISHKLFEVLTSASGGRLHFSVYDKYLSGLERYCLIIAYSLGVLFSIIYLYKVLSSFLLFLWLL